MVYSITDIAEYTICPVRYFLNMYSKNVPDRYLAKCRLYGNTPAFVEVLLGNVKREETTYQEMAKKIVDGLLYHTRNIDENAMSNMFLSIETYLREHGIEVAGPGETFRIKYGRYEIESCYDMVITDPKTMRKYPALIDYSNTKYEAQYNPISYRAQTCMSHFNLRDTNTVVKVLTISNKSFWSYDDFRYSKLLPQSISEIVRAIEYEMFPMRFGWWCSGCHWRGMWHKTPEVKKEAIPR